MTRDCETYIDFCRVPLGTKWIYVGNNLNAEVRGVGTYQLMLHGGRTLLLHDL